MFQPIVPPASAEHFNLVDAVLLRHVREGRGHDPALLFDSSAITYDALAAATARARELLRVQGVKRADRVGLLIPDSPAYVYLFLAAISLGAITVPINPKHNLEDAWDMLQQVGVKVAFVHESVAMDAAVSTWRGLRVVAVDSMLSSLVPGAQSDSVEAFTPEVTVGSDTAFLLFSSGTTGPAKAIPRRHADVAWVAGAFAEDLLQLSSADRVLAVPKLTFGYALVGSLFFSLLYGASAVLIPQVSSAPTMLEAIRRYAPTIFLAQPRMLAEMADLVSNPSELGSIRLTVSAGDVLSDIVRQRWQEKTGLRVVDGFGSTEVGHIFICNTSSEHPANSIGHALRGFQLQLIGDDGREVSDGAPGRLRIRGMSVSPGYWNDPERTLRHFTDGWFLSDDVFVKKDAFYFYAGRRDDMIKTGCGEWVVPHHLERLLLADAAVRDCAVVGAHDDNDVVRVKACVVRTRSTEPDHLLARRLRHLAELEWPRLEHMRIHAIEFMDAIPRSTNGKIQRHLLAPRTLTEFAYEC